MLFTARELEALVAIDARRPLGGMGAAVLSLLQLGLVIRRGDLYYLTPDGRAALDRLSGPPTGT